MNRLSPEDLDKIAVLIKTATPAQLSAAHVEEIAKRTASEVAAHLAMQIAELHGGQVMAKMQSDFMVNEMLDNKTERRKSCADHAAWITSLQKEFFAHSEKQAAMVNKIKGAARIIAWGGGILSVVGGIIAEIWRGKHGG